MKRRLQHAAALLPGLLFGAGLVVSGMTQPKKVLGFLDPFGQFDASLLFVMVGAIAVYALADRVRRTRRAPLFGPRFVVPANRRIDARLLAGAVIFGVGWGLAGYCPGPSLVALAGASVPTLLFVLAMVAGMFVTERVSAAWARRRPPPSAADESAEVIRVGCVGRLAYTLGLTVRSPIRLSC
jgi:uncharacterized protein